MMLSATGEVLNQQQIFKIVTADGTTSNMIIDTLSNVNSTANTGSVNTSSNGAEAATANSSATTANIVVNNILPTQHSSNSKVLLSNLTVLSKPNVGGSSAQSAAAGAGSVSFASAGTQVTQQQPQSINFVNAKNLSYLSTAGNVVTGTSVNVSGATSSPSSPATFATMTISSSGGSINSGAGGGKQQKFAITTTSPYKSSSKQQTLHASATGVNSMPTSGGLTTTTTYLVQQPQPQQQSQRVANIVQTTTTRPVQMVSRVQTILQAASAAPHQQQQQQPSTQHILLQTQQGPQQQLQQCVVSAPGTVTQKYVTSPLSRYSGSGVKKSLPTATFSIGSNNSGSGMKLITHNNKISASSLPVSNPTILMSTQNQQQQSPGHGGIKTFIAQQQTQQQPAAQSSYAGVNNIVTTKSKTSKYLKQYNHSINSSHSTNNLTSTILAASLTASSTLSSSVSTATSSASSLPVYAINNQKSSASLSSTAKITKLSSKYVLQQQAQVTPTQLQQITNLPQGTELQPKGNSGNMLQATATAAASTSNNTGNSHSNSSLIYQQQIVSGANINSTNSASPVSGSTIKFVNAHGTVIQQHPAPMNLQPQNNLSTGNATVSSASASLSATSATATSAASSSTASSSSASGTTLFADDIMFVNGTPMTDEVSARILQSMAQKSFNNQQQRYQQQQQQQHQKFSHKTANSIGGAAMAPPHTVQGVTHQHYTGSSTLSPSAASTTSILVSQKDCQQLYSPTASVATASPAAAATFPASTAAHYLQQHSSPSTVTAISSSSSSSSTPLTATSSYFSILPALATSSTISTVAATSALTSTSISMPSAYITTGGATVSVASITPSSSAPTMPANQLSSSARYTTALHGTSGGRSHSMERKSHEMSYTRRSSDLYKANNASSRSNNSQGTASASIVLAPMEQQMQQQQPIIHLQTMKTTMSMPPVNVPSSVATAPTGTIVTLSSAIQMPPTSSYALSSSSGNLGKLSGSVLGVTSSNGRSANLSSSHNNSSDDDLIGEEVRPIPVVTHDIRLQILHAVLQDHTYANAMPTRLPSDFNVQQIIQQQKQHSASMSGNSQASYSLLASAANGAGALTTTTPATAMSMVGCANSQQWSLGGIAAAVNAAGINSPVTYAALNSLQQQQPQTTYATLYGQQIPRTQQQDDDAHSAISTGSRVALGDIDPGEETETAPEAEAEDDSVTRCICDLTHDDGYMICCDKCFAWQHVDCMGIDRQNIPDEYLCELCQPRPVDKAHARALQIIKRKEQQTQMLLATQQFHANNALANGAGGAAGTATGSMYATIGGHSSHHPHTSDAFYSMQQLQSHLQHRSNLHHGKHGIVDPSSVVGLSNVGSGPDYHQGGALAKSALQGNSSTASYGRKSKLLKKTKEHGSSSGKRSRKSEKLAAGAASSHLGGLSGTKAARKETKKTTKRKGKLANISGSSGDGTQSNVASKHAANLRNWIENYELAVTNHYSPELRARLHAITKQPSLMQSILNTENKSLKDCVNFDNRATTVPHAGGKILISKLDMGPNYPIFELRGKFMLTTQFKTQNPSLNMNTPPLTNHQLATGYKAHKTPGPFIFFYQLPGVETQTQTMNADGTYPPQPPQPPYLKGPEICVDTRTYGNDARFVRRSCRPNAEIQHLFEKGTIHLFIVSSMQIRASTEITIPHEPHDLHAVGSRKSSNMMVKPTSTACACGLGSDCLFAAPLPKPPKSGRKSVNEITFNSSAAVQLTMGLSNAPFPFTGLTGISGAGVATGANTNQNSTFGTTSSPGGHKNSRGLGLSDTNNVNCSPNYSGMNRNRSTSSSDGSNISASNNSGSGFQSPSVTQMGYNNANLSGGSGNAIANNMKSISANALGNTGTAGSSSALLSANVLAISSGGNSASSMHDSGVYTSSSSPSVSIPSPTAPQHLHSPNSTLQQQQQQQALHQPAGQSALAIASQNSTLPAGNSVLQQTLVAKQQQQQQQNAHQQILASLPTPMLLSPQHLQLQQQQEHKKSQQPKQQASLSTEKPTLLLSPSQASGTAAASGDDEKLQTAKAQQQQPLSSESPGGVKSEPATMPTTATASANATALQILNNKTINTETSTPVKKTGERDTLNAKQVSATAESPEQKQQQRENVKPDAAAAAPNTVAPSASPVKNATGPHRNAANASRKLSTKLHRQANDSSGRHAKPSGSGAAKVNTNETSAAPSTSSTKALPSKEKPKLSREDRKMQAILRAIEEMERNQQRKKDSKQGKGPGSKRRNASQSNESNNKSNNSQNMDSSAELETSIAAGDGEHVTAAASSAAGNTVAHVTRRGPQGARKKKRKSSKSSFGVAHTAQKKRRKSRISSNDSDAITSESDAAHSSPNNSLPKASAINRGASKNAKLERKAADRDPTSTSTPRKGSLNDNEANGHDEAFKSPQHTSNVSSGGNTAAGTPATPPTPISSACLLIEAAVAPLQRYFSMHEDFKCPTKTKTKKSLMSSWLQASTPPSNAMLEDAAESDVATLKQKEAADSIGITAAANMSVAAMKIEEFIYQTERSSSPFASAPLYGAGDTVALRNETKNVHLELPHSEIDATTGEVGMRNLQLPLHGLTNNSSVKKRWLRQAISEETDDGNTSAALTPLSATTTPSTASPTGGVCIAAGPSGHIMQNGFTTPLKKRRLVIDSKEEEIYESHDGSGGAVGELDTTNAVAVSSAEDDKAFIDVMKCEKVDAEKAERNLGETEIETDAESKAHVCSESSDRKFAYGCVSIKREEQDEKTVLNYKIEVVKETLKPDIESTALDQDDEVDILRSPSPGQKIIAEDNLVKIEPEDISGNYDVKIDVEREESMATDKFDEFVAEKRKLENTVSEAAGASASETNAEIAGDTKMQAKMHLKGFSDVKPVVFYESPSKFDEQKLSKDEIAEVIGSGATQSFRNGEIKRNNTAAELLSSSAATTAPSSITTTTSLINFSNELFRKHFGKSGGLMGVLKTENADSSKDNSSSSSDNKSSVSSGDIKKSEGPSKSKFGGKCKSEPQNPDDDKVTSEADELDSSKKKTKASLKNQPVSSSIVEERLDDAASRVEESSASGAQSLNSQANNLEEASATVDDEKSANKLVDGTAASSTDAEDSDKLSKDKDPKATTPVKNLHADAEAACAAVDAKSINQKSDAKQAVTPEENASKAQKAATTAAVSNGSSSAVGSSSSSSKKVYKRERERGRERDRDRGERDRERDRRRKSRSRSYDRWRDRDHRDRDRDHRDRERDHRDRERDHHRRDRDYHHERSSSSSSYKKSSSSSSSKYSKRQSSSTGGSSVPSTGLSAEKEKNRSADYSTSSTRKRHLTYENDGSNRDHQSPYYGKYRRDSRDYSREDAKRRSGGGGGRDAAVSHNVEEPSAIEPLYSIPVIGAYNVGPPASIMGVAGVPPSAVNIAEGEYQAIHYQSTQQIHMQHRMPPVGYHNQQPPPQSQLLREHPTIPHFNNIVTAPVVAQTLNVAAGMPIQPTQLANAYVNNYSTGGTYHSAESMALATVAQPTLTQQMPTVPPPQHGLVSANDGSSASQALVGAAAQLPFYNNIYGKMVEDNTADLHLSQATASANNSANDVAAETLSSVASAEVVSLSSYLDTAKSKSFSSLGGYITPNVSLTDTNMDKVVASNNNITIEPTKANASAMSAQPLLTTSSMIAKTSKMANKTSCHDPRLNPALNAPEPAPTPRRKLSINEYRKRMQQSSSTESNSGGGGGGGGGSGCSVPSTPTTPDAAAATAHSFLASATRSPAASAAIAPLFSGNVTVNSILSDLEKGDLATTSVINRCTLNSPEHQSIVDKVNKDIMHTKHAALLANSAKLIDDDIIDIGSCKTDDGDLLSFDINPKKGQFNAEPTQLEKQQEKLCERLKSLKNHQSTLQTFMASGAGGYAKKENSTINAPSNTKNSTIPHSAADLDNCFEAISSNSTSLASSRDSTPERLPSKTRNSAADSSNFNGDFPKSGKVEFDEISRHIDSKLVVKLNSNSNSMFSPITSPTSSVPPSATTSPPGTPPPTQRTATPTPLSASSESETFQSDSIDKAATSGERKADEYQGAASCSKSSGPKVSSSHADDNSSIEGNTAHKSGDENRMADG